jgi:hypothetical protein
VLTELKQRGVRDILICCVDGLKGFPEAIEAIFRVSARFGGEVGRVIVGLSGRFAAAGSLGRLRRTRPTRRRPSRRLLGV